MKNKNEVIKNVQTMLQLEKEILFAYLFGSFLTGKKYHDVDVAVYLRTKKDFHYEFFLEDKLTKKLKLPVDVRILNFAPLPFLYNVISSGQVIVDNDPDKRADFETYILKSYFDYIHIRDEYLAEFKNAV